MTLEATLVHNAYEQQDYTPGSAALAGVVVSLPDDRAGIVIADLAASEKGAVYTGAVVDVLKDAGDTFTAGDYAWFDLTEREAVLDGSKGDGDIRLGTVLADDPDGQTDRVRVRLNAVAGVIHSV